MANKRNFKNYFTFRWLITPGIIRVIHVIGIIILNLLLLAGFVGSIILAVVGSDWIDLEGGYLALGIFLIILGGIVTFFLIVFERFAEEPRSELQQALFQVIGRDPRPQAHEERKGPSAPFVEHIRIVPDLG